MSKCLKAIRLPTQGQSEVSGLITHSTHKKTITRRKIIEGHRDPRLKDPGSEKFSLSIE